MGLYIFKGSKVEISSTNKEERKKGSQEKKKKYHGHSKTNKSVNQWRRSPFESISR